MLSSAFEPKMSPMMKQFHEAKRICPEALLLFRMGDFYEMFFEDAKTAARLLGLTLTSREKGPNGTPMAGFPHHQLDSYIAKIIAAGYRAAVCEQMEDPKTLKQGQIVKRAVTRIVTAGTITEETLLDPKVSNYLLAFYIEDLGNKDTSLRRHYPQRSEARPLTNTVAGIAWLELSTGAFFAATAPIEHLAEHIARVAPSEIIYSENETFPLPPQTNIQKTNIQISKRPDWVFNLQSAHQLLLKQFGTATLEGFGFTDKPLDLPAIRAAGAVLDYVNETQRNSSVHIDSIAAFALNTQLEIDESSRRMLEITRTIRSGKREGSLLGVLDRCITPMGSRELAEAVAGPLLDIHEINERLDAVEELYNNLPVISEIQNLLRQVYDLQRILTRVVQNRGTPRDLSMIGRTLRLLPYVRTQIEKVLKEKNNSPKDEPAEDEHTGLLESIYNWIDPCTELAELLKSALKEDIPLNVKEGGFIKSTFSEELKELRQLQSGGKDWIANFQADEIRRSGIPSLKVGFTQVFGYYIEITNTHQTKIPDNYIRKQTLKNAERYITPELKEYEEKVLTAAERAVVLEYEILAELRTKTCGYRQAMQRTAKALAQLDVLTTLALLARDRGYCRPVLTEEPVLKIIDGRHPVLDAAETAGVFVPNDTVINTEDKGIIQLITGPNMSGKSTYIRQNALLCIMAQIGSFIPAREAVIGICDKIFARIGASDEIARGQSTFMVEMTETARILNQATERSLVILDEIGRGTSTYEGVSLAWSIAEYIHNQINCRTLFATHYHELTDLADMLDNISNLNVAVRENNGEVVFLYKIIEGAADKSYGIHVAKIAGVPKEVISRAQDILNELEQQHHRNNAVVPSVSASGSIDNTALEKAVKNRPVKKITVGENQMILFGGE
jgi:DNA mismatch repair protein MutS